MKAEWRRQLPRNLHHLLLVELEADDSITILCGDHILPFYTPIFVDGIWKGVFSIDLPSRLIHSRRQCENKNSPVMRHWPREQLFLNVRAVVLFSAGRDLVNDLLCLDRKAGLSVLNANPKKPVYDPRLDPVMLWDMPNLKPDLALSNIDKWVEKVEQRRLALLQKTAVSSSLDVMGGLGLMLGMIASLPPGLVLPVSNVMDVFDPWISQEADAFLRRPIFPGSRFGVINVDDLRAFLARAGGKDVLDRSDFMLTEKLYLRVPVPAFLPFLSRTLRPLLFMGEAFVGVSALSELARKMFIAGWKTFALQLYGRLYNGAMDDPALAEFLQKVRLRPAGRKTTALISSSPNQLLPVPSSLAPPCLQKIFKSDGRLVLKHYARWQLAELAVDMDWSKTSVLALVPPSYRSEISASFDGYKRTGPTMRRCQIYMRSTDFCPYSPQTYKLCCSQVDDIEDMSPALSFQYRLKESV